MASIPATKQNFLKCATLLGGTEIQLIADLIMQTLTLDVFTDYI